MSDMLLTHDSFAVIPRGGSLRDWLRLHTWSARRRIAVAASIAFVAALSVVALDLTADLAGVRAAQTGVDDAARKLAEAQRDVARLPMLRAEVGTQEVPLHEGTDADDVRRISELISASGLALLALAPEQSATNGAKPLRSMKLVAQGRFAQLRAFLGALAEKPGIIVPADLTITRTGESVSIGATLQLFGALAPLSVDDAANQDSTIHDPFAGGTIRGAGKGELRLAGMLQDRAGIVALVESPSGTEAVRAGQSVMGARVEHIEPSRIVVASAGNRATLTWPEDEK